jgi:hypothetical protein
MDSDYIFKHGYLRNHKVSKKLFDGMLKRLQISTGNSHKTDDNEDIDNKNNGNTN